MSEIWVTIFDEGNIDFFIGGAFDNEESAILCAKHEMSSSNVKIYKFDRNNVKSEYAIEA